LNKSATVDLVRGEADLIQILELQRNNLSFTEDGFVTVVHSLELLRQFHQTMPSVVARHEGRVVAYALSMPRRAVELVPVLDPFFHRIEKLPILRDQRWYVMGQVCVAQGWRGQGLFDAMYRLHREHFSSDFDWLVTEISLRNPRSVKAHQRVGFVEIDHFVDETDEWSVVGLRLGK